MIRLIHRFGQHSCCPHQSPVHQALAHQVVVNPRLLPSTKVCPWLNLLLAKPLLQGVYQSPALCKPPDHCCVPPSSSLRVLDAIWMPHIPVTHHHLIFRLHLVQVCSQIQQCQTDRSGCTPTASNLLSVQLLQMIQHLPAVLVQLSTFPRPLQLRLQIHHLLHLPVPGPSTWLLVT